MLIYKSNIVPPEGEKKLKSLRKKISNDLNADLKGIKQRLVSAEQRISSGPYKVEDRLYLRDLLLTAVEKFEEVKKPHHIEDRREFLKETREKLEAVEEELKKLDGEQKASACFHTQP